jgi:hypothetical protein
VDLDPHFTMHPHGEIPDLSEETSPLVITDMYDCRDLFDININFTSSARSSPSLFLHSFVSLFSFVFRFLLFPSFYYSVLLIFSVFLCISFDLATQSNTQCFRAHLLVHRSKAFVMFAILHLLRERGRVIVN